jgi:hypothetical protein
MESSSTLATRSMRAARHRDDIIGAHCRHFCLCANDAERSAHQFQRPALGRDSEHDFDQTSCDHDGGSDQIPDGQHRMVLTVADRSAVTAGLSAPPILASANNPEMACERISLTVS